ncbi:MAG: hypothetical protein GXO76_09130 [Calditrichaeota bacterium]|nr:hypothetical protein [Calditrichota bacterium]
MMVDSGNMRTEMAIERLHPEVLPPLETPLRYPFPVLDEVASIRSAKELPSNLKNLLKHLNISENLWAFATGLSREGRLPEFEQRRLAQLRHLGLEIAPLAEVVDTHPRARELAFSYWPKNEWASFHKEHWQNGTFVRFPGGVRVADQPVCTYCLMEKAFSPAPHSLILFEKDSAGTIILGSTSPKVIRAPFYLPGVEIFLRENATGTVILLHSFPPYLESRPIVRARVGKNARLNLMIVTLFPGKSLGRDIEITVDGEKGEALVQMSSCSKNRNLSVNQVSVILDAPETRADIRTRGLSTEQGRQISYVSIDAREKAVKSEGHLEAVGLLQSDQASYEVIPGLISRVDDVFLDHEAFIGRILEEAVFYLKTRGFSEKQAMFLLIKSHLGPIVERLPETLRWETLKIAELIVNGEAKEW